MSCLFRLIKQDQWIDGLKVELRWGSVSRELGAGGGTPTNLLPTRLRIVPNMRAVAQHILPSPADV